MPDECIFQASKVQVGFIDNMDFLGIHAQESVYVILRVISESEMRRHCRIDHLQPKDNPPTSILLCLADRCYKNYVKDDGCEIEWKYVIRIFPTKILLILRLLLLVL
ncbi:hypothetical protein ACTXT7_008518 [Hymenolepis weldensis]